MKRNLQAIKYALYQSQTEAVDEDGWLTGENSTDYAEPVEILCSVSPASGAVSSELFGTLESYDKIIITDDLSCPIDENTQLYIDNLRAPDYIVKRVAKSLNHIAYAASKVNVS